MGRRPYWTGEDTDVASDYDRVYRVCSRECRSAATGETPYLRAVPRSEGQRNPGVAGNRQARLAFRASQRRRSGESGVRAIPDELAGKARNTLEFPPTTLPLKSDPKGLSSNDFNADLGALGYPGFSYLQGKPNRNPAELLLNALDQSDLDSG
jgi:hypothetical protein